MKVRLSCNMVSASIDRKTTEVTRQSHLYDSTHYRINFIEKPHILVIRWRYVTTVILMHVIEFGTYAQGCFPLNMIGYCKVVHYHAWILGRLRAWRRFHMANE